MSVDLKIMLNYTEEEKINHLSRLELTELGKKDMLDNWKQRIQESYRGLKQAEVLLDKLRKY
jgi:hypothetical protein